MNILVKTLKEDAILHLTDEFHKIDKDHTGMITLDELKNSVMHSEHKISDDQIEAMFQKIDATGNNKLNYTEFIAATLDVEKVLTDERLM